MLPFYLFRIVAHFHFVSTLLEEFILKVCEWEKHAEQSMVCTQNDASTIENPMT